MKESRKQFISRVLFMAEEINKSDKGNVLDIMSMMDFQLMQRETEQMQNAKSIVVSDIIILKANNHSNKYIEKSVSNSFDKCIVQITDK